jgi:leucine dehydrogenase
MGKSITSPKGVGRRRIIWRDEESGLCAVLVMDSVVRGPAVGGIRCMSYKSIQDAYKDADLLARAMTLKCALAGLSAGGGKVVMIDHKGLKREEAFSFLGKRVDELEGEFRTAGDLGTTVDDLKSMADHCRFVHINEDELLWAAALGVTVCIEACVRVKNRDSLRGLRVAVQGCGHIGSALADALAERGAELFVADLNRDRAEECAERLGATVLAPDEVLVAPVDIVAPCANGGAITERIASKIQAWAICGGANNACTDYGELILRERDILHVPSILSSAGAVIEGFGQSHMKLTLEERRQLIEELGVKAEQILERSLRSGCTPASLARDIAHRAVRAGKAA